MQQGINDTAPPLVSVGIPCYNRPELLRRAVRAVQAQTHQNLEIIISDNASPDPAVEILCREIANADSRVRYVRQVRNLGPMPNFEYVLKAASADYFFWAADDDWIEPAFVQTCMDAHAAAGRATVLVTPEAWYETPDGAAFPYFAEGDALRRSPADTTQNRVASVLRHGFGNLIYGIFKRHALFHRGQPLTQWIGRTLNELPFFALVASKGTIVSLPTPLWHKRAPTRVCLSAKWERAGGWKPDGPGLLNPRRMLVSQRRYHRDVAADIERAIRDSDLTGAEQDKVLAVSRETLWRHWRVTAVGWKPLITSPASARPMASG